MSTDQELEHTDCYLCGNDKPKTLYAIKGFRNDQRSFNVVQCDVCSLVYINPRYSLHENFALYNESYYADTAVDPSGRTRSFFTDRENKINDHKMEVSYIKKYKKEGRILDFGAASGFFLDALNGVWEKYAVDISEFALSHIKDPAVRKFNGTLLDAHYGDKFFDVIYVGHTLDRLIDLKENIVEMKRILKKDGIILVTTPNIGSLCAMLFEDRFRLLYSNHLVYFSKETLQKFLDEIGLRMLDVKYPFYGTSFFSWRKLPVDVAKIVFRAICKIMHIKIKMPSPPFWGNVMSIMIEVKMSDKKKTYWKSFLGIPRYKIDWYFKYYMYKLFGITFDKLYDQKDYWNTRGAEYFEEVFRSKHYNYEIFFQDMFIEKLRNLEFKSFFEAGCGFGWNVKRVKQEFPDVRIGGLDFSLPQLKNSKVYIPEICMPAAQGDACFIPFKDKTFDVGLTLGVFMNIHPTKIDNAIDEMIRVSRKYIIHLEWDQDNTKPALREKRIFKTNIVSHNYRRLYENRGKKVLKFETYKDFEGRFYQRFKSTKVSTWESFEGPEKYIFIVIRL